MDDTRPPFASFLVPSGSTAHRVKSSGAEHKTNCFWIISQFLKDHLAPVVEILTMNAGVRGRVGMASEGGLPRCPEDVASPVFYFVGNAFQLLLPSPMRCLR